MFFEPALACFWSLIWRVFGACFGVFFDPDLACMLSCLGMSFEPGLATFACDGGFSLSPAFGRLFRLQ